MAVRLSLGTGLILVLASLPPSALAEPLTLDLPQPAHQTAAPAVATGDLLLPSGPWSEGRVPGAYLSGRVSQTAWRIEQPLATADLMSRLRANVLAAGFTLTYECATTACGGFDFRYAIPVLPEPDMHVDLGDFRYLAARRTGEGVTLLVSRSTQAAYVQITLVGPQPAAPVAQAAATGNAGADASTLPDAQPAAGASQAEPSGNLVDRLLAQGSAPLDDLAFASGKADLQPGDYGSLAELAAWLMAHPDMTVVLVGHSDATGGAAGNLALSRARAQSARQALIALGVAADQVAADGVGFLAPRTTNLTEEGRARNRWVEVVLTSTQLPSATP